MPTALVITNRRPDEAGGRPAKLATRERLLAEKDWEVVYDFITEPYWRSFLSGIIRALRTARRHDVDMVVSMNNPFHLQAIGFLVSWITGRPWVAEFRDPMLTHPDWEDGSLLKRVAGVVERLTVHCANRVCWHDGIQLPNGYFVETYPDLPPDHFVKLPYLGFDQARFEDVEPRSFEGFTITYAGSFYEGWIEPDDFLAGFGEFVYQAAAGSQGDGDGDIDCDANVRANFFGDWNDRYEGIAEFHDIADRVESHGFVPHEEVVPALLGSDALLYVGGTDPDNRLNIPSKIWDYVAAEKPILALVDPDFAVADFIEEENLGIVVHPDDHEGIAEAIRGLVAGEVDYDPDPSLREEVSRAHNVDAFTNLLDEVLAERER